MADSEEKINLRGTIKAPQELVSRIQDETRRLRKKRGLTKDPPAWSVVSAAMDVYEEREREGGPSNDEEQELVKVFISYLHEHGPDSLPRKILFNHLGYKKIDKSNNVSHLPHNRKKLG
jgi:hypothetical protein